MAEETAVEPQTEIDDGVQAETPGISQWEFIDRAPTRQEVLDLLGTLPPQWGVQVLEFADYVQALPASKKTKRPHNERPEIMVDTYLDVWTLYMGVAGRQHMLRQIQEQNEWSVDLEPERTTPTGIPGFLLLEPRLVYRERMIVHDKAGRCLGRKSGTAWVPFTGGKQAAGSNPFEKVETSARGRAIAAWGIGVLPGSGVASVEEMQNAGQNRAHLEAEQAQGQGRQGGGQPRRSRGELLQEALTVAEELRQERGIDEFEMRAKVGAFLSGNLGIANAYDEAKGEIAWDKVKDGQITLLVNSLRDSLRALRDAGTQV